MNKWKIIFGFLLFLGSLILATFTTTGTICMLEECYTILAACPLAGIFYIISGIGIGIMFWGLLASYSVVKK
jgi:hypothetical protein